MTGRPTDAAPVVDPAAIVRFVEVVFGYLEGYVPVRVLSEVGTPQERPHSQFPSTGELAEVLARLAPHAARKSRALYVVPATVAAPGSGRAEDIATTGVVLVDLDAGDIAAARDHLTRHLGSPTMLVASGGNTEDGQAKVHIYWRLTEAASGADLERVRAVRELVATKVGGDTSFRSLHQPIRVPGSIHGKNGQQASVRLLGHRDVEYELGDLEEAAATMPSLRVTASSAFGIDTGARTSAAELATRVIRAGGLDEATRFGALSKVIGHWIRNARNGRCTLGAAWQAVVDHNAAMIAPPWDEARLWREFEALLKRDIASHGPMPGPDAVTTWDPVALSDDALAAAFVARHGADWRYVGVWGAWYGWTDTLWMRDETGGVREAMRQVCRTAAMTTNRPNEARRVASDKTMAAALRIAATDPKLATRACDWDAHSMLLNTPAGVVDLETGEISSHDPDLLLTQITAASPGSGCPRWSAFLDEVTAGDRELRCYLQRLAGYVLTGSVAEQIFAFFHGSGANGKSVFIQTIGAVLGDYAATATLDTFMASSGNRHLTELAGLRAARLVIVPETETGRTWAEARIKTVTGGEMVRANFMHRDHFEYRPQFKLLVAGNHRPALATVGEAMRRRLHLVPFNVTIPPEARDRTLAEKLLAERDGILGWMLEGCAEWRKVGLAAPAAVLSAAASYFADEDLVGQWIAETCDEGGDRRATSNALFQCWSAWAEAGGHPRGTRKALGEALRQRGYRDGKVGRDRGWHGLAPRRHDGREAGE